MRGFPILLLRICDARAQGKPPCVRGRWGFLSLALRARGECPIVCSGAQFHGVCATRAQGKPPCVRDPLNLRLVRYARAGNASLLARIPNFTTYLRRARGECILARAADGSIFLSCYGRSGNAPCVRGAPLYDLRATRARGMLLCVRGFPSLLLICDARGGCILARAAAGSFFLSRYGIAGNAPMRARGPTLRPTCDARAGKASLRARAPKFAPWSIRARGE